MKNLKLLSLNLDKKLLLNRNKANHLVAIKDFIMKEYADIIMIQSSKYKEIEAVINPKDYQAFISNDHTVATLLKNDMPILYSKDYEGIGNIVCTGLSNNSLALINVNINPKVKRKLEYIYDLYSSKDNQEYTKSQIISGTFSKDFSIENFIANTNLLEATKDIATSHYLKKRKSPTNHLLLSKNLESLDTKRAVGIVDVMGLTKEYPICANITYKKIKK